MVGKVLNGGFEYVKGENNKVDRVNKIAAELGKMKTLVAQTTVHNDYMMNCLSALDNVLATCVENINKEVWN